MSEKDVLEILEGDNLIYTAAIHWNVVRSAQLKEPPRVIYIHEFISTLSKKICGTFDASILNKRAVIHLAHWYTEGMIREEYAKLVDVN